MESQQLKDDITKILNAQQLSVLSTYGSEYPYSTLVGFTSTDDLKYIIFATIRNTRKYNNIKEQPNVSMLVDTRSKYIRDFSKAQAVSILGRAEEAEDSEREKFADLHLQKHPYLKSFVQNPNCAIIKIEVHKYIMASKFQEVKELDMQ